MGETQNWPFQLSFNSSLKVDFQGSRVTDVIENYRSELIWRLLRQCPYIGTGLRNAGGRGGWLS